MTPEQLKASILQYAIQGKLVEQRAEDGNAEDLYKQIQAEKQQLIKDGKIKKSKPLPPISADEIPFDIPDTWKWVRLGEIIKIESGKGLTAANMEQGSVPVYGGNGITGYHNQSFIHEKTVVIGRVGFYCGSVYITENEAWVTDNAFLTTFPKHSIDRDFLVHLLRYMNLGKNNNATAQPVVSGKKIYPLLFPLPPLAEQKRIVEKIEQLLPLVDMYAKAYEKLEHLNTKFPEEMKKAILQYAIQGKLVEQRAEEGNAEDLYKQIQAEKQQLIKDGKIKKSKPLPPISADEIPFDIPDTWKWVRVDDIVSKTIKRGKSPTYTECSHIQVFAQKCNVKTGGINMSIARFLDETKLQKYGNEDFLINDDIVINSTGTGTMGRVGYFKDNDRINDMKIVPDSHITVVRTANYMLPRYLYHVLKVNQKYLESMGEGSTNQKELKPFTIMNMIIPLPPLAEQKRIVEKIEQLLPLCDKLK